MRKLVLLVVTVVSLYSCNCENWKFKRGITVHRKLDPETVLLVLDTVTKSGQNFYKVEDQFGKQYTYGEFELEDDVWN